MPNFKLQPYHYNDIHRNLQNLLNRRLYAVRQEFPLTRDEVQRMFMSVEVLERISELKNVYNYEGLSTYRYVYLNTPPHDNLLRASMLIFYGKPNFYALNNQYNDCDRMAGGGYTAHFTVDWSHLSEERVSLLVDWIKKEITEHRIKALAETKINEYFNLSPSMWHIMSQWEALTMGFDKDMRQRAIDKPLRSGRYTWHHEPNYRTWFIGNKNYIDYINTMLLSAKVLPEIEVPRVDNMPWGSTVAEVISYTKLDGELV